jgi:hypothetical protein
VLAIVFKEIGVDATSPEDAAKQALKIHKDTNSLATIFDVYRPANETYEGCELVGRYDVVDETSVVRIQTSKHKQKVRSSLAWALEKFASVLGRLHD